MASTDVSALAAELALAVELTMSVDASQAARREAYDACDRFKETSPLCAEVGLYLAAGVHHSPIARHFGLQLMEHTVKYRWNHISQTEKLFIKENAMKLVGAGSVGEEPHMKDALSRVVVEMVKREWPQQWPGLLDELSTACQRGPAQTELVLLVFLRLVEDVALLQTLESNQRRKDIYQALTTHMAEIFAFFLRLIELHVSQFRMHTEMGNNPQAAAHGRVVQVVLVTLTGFVEWVSISHIMAHEGRLLQILCLLLNDNVFQNPAAECLVQIVNRKGKPEERKPLLIMFSDEASRCILAASQAERPVFDEQHYLFLKKLVQVLLGLSSQLCALWGRENGIQSRPANFQIYLDALLAFSRHPSLTLAHLANPIWVSLMKHDPISRDSVFISYIPLWLECTAPKVIKVSYPSGRCTGPVFDAAAYARYDYDSEEEYQSFFYRTRSDFSDTFRHAIIVAPLVTFGYVERWLVKCLQQPPITSGLGMQDPIYLEWEALAQILDSVLSRVLQATERPSIASGLRLLEMCLSWQPADPLLLSTLLTCISALFVFLSMSTGQMTSAGNCVAISGAALLPRVLDKIFSALVFSPPGQSKESRSRPVQNVRRHAASLMVKIGHKYPLLLLPVFDQIKNTVDNLNRQEGPAQLSMLEKVTLQEALLLISNHFCDYERQRIFIGEVMAEAHAQWQVMAAAGAFLSAPQFMSFVGLAQPPVKPSADDSCGQNRSQLVFCINMVLGAVKRCSWPEDPERAQRGGFVVGLTESGNPICRNPATPHVVPLLPHVLAQMRVFNQLWSNKSQELLSPGYHGALAMLEVEKANLLGLVGCSSGSGSGGNSGSAGSGTDHCEQSSRNQTPLERMQHFLSGIHESCHHLLGAASMSLGRDLYQLHGLGPAVVDSVLANLEDVPDYRLRSIIRVFLKPFIYSCPSAFYESVVLPIAAHIFPFMAERLISKWPKLSQNCDDGGEESSDAQEVLEDILIRALTREHLDVIRVALVGGSLPSETMMDMEEISMDAPSAPARNALANEVISDLGIMLLRHQRTCLSLIWTIVGSVSCNDSNASYKATQLLMPVVRQLLSDGSLTADMAANVMASVLRALALHGQHQANQGSLLSFGAQLYELLRPLFPAVALVMQQIPNVNLVELQKLDEKIAAGSSKGNKVDKAKKDLFKKLTSSLIGRSIGQLFRKEVKIENLPQLVLPEKPKNELQNFALDLFF